MEKTILMAFIATLGTWLVTALGAGTVLFFRKPDSRLLDLMLGFAAGVMIAASFWSLLQPAIERAEAISALPAAVVAGSGFLTGALFLWLSDKVLSLSHRQNGVDPLRQTGRIRMLVLSITLHNIPEGLAVGVAFGALQAEPGPDTLWRAISIAIGIGLQNFPEGAAVSVPLRREGWSRRKSFFVGQASGSVEPLAGCLGAALVTAAEPILPYALSFAAGAMILVAVHELIPECQQRQGAQPYLATAGIILGFTCMMLLDVMLG